MNTVVFFGSGPVAAESLKLLQKDFAIEAVITKPRPPHHRGLVPVMELAEKLDLPVFTPSNKTQLSELMQGRPFTSRLGVVIDYGIIINQDVIDYFPLGIVNSHFSLLPEWRGADPISFAILSGQKRTGVSNMLINDKMDEGKVIGVGFYELTGKETTPELTSALIQLSHGLLNHDLPLLFSGKSNGGVEQAELHKSIPGYPTQPSYSRKLTKEDGILDFSKPAEVLEREIRAFIEWPKSRASLNGLDVVVTAAKVYNETLGDPGTVVVKNSSLFVSCGQSSLQLLMLKPAGKQEMPTKAFLAGYATRLRLR